MPTFVVERYLPGVSQDEAAAVIERERELADTMTAAGLAVRVLHATLVESDEVVLSFVEAPSRTEVFELGRRSGTPPDRVTPAVAVPSTEAHR